MSDLSRRNFLAHGAVAAGAVVVVGQLGDGAASAASTAGAEPAWFGADSVASEPFVVFIRDAARGEVSVLRGEEEIVYTDRALVGRLQRAMRRAAW
jgi:TAT (twin-arginine translocation) pathway signal sequence